jgi:hypothetical protein
VVLFAHDRIYLAARLAQNELKRGCRRTKTGAKKGREGWVKKRGRTLLASGPVGLLKTAPLPYAAALS